MKKIEDGFRHYEEISERHFQDAEKLNYYTNTWVEKRLYSEIQTLLKEVELNLCADTLCMIVTCIRHDARRIKSINEWLNNTDEDFEFLKLYKALWDIVNNDEPATSISINSCKRILVKTQHAKCSVKRILDALESSCKFNLRMEYEKKAEQYIHYDWKPYEIKNYYQNFRKHVVKKLDALLFIQIEHQPLRYFFIDQILAIAGYEKHKIVSYIINGKDGVRKRDNINRKMKQIFEKA
ncbi:MAG: hypothetical protein IPK10_18710 [Bacteroidetes bacterium]|nr:hypothetical protein [Bacteroidota bacterium]